VDRYILRVHHEKARDFSKVSDFFLERTKDFDFVLTENITNKEGELINAVVAALETLGGKVDTQSPLVSEVVTSLNCGVTWAKKAISLTLQAGKIRAIAGGHGRSTGYHLPV